MVVTPGTGVLCTVAAGLGRGGRASVIAAIGCTLGTIPHMLAAITGLAALLHTSATAFQVVLSRPRVLTWMRRVFAGTFGALGARLAFAER